MIVDTQLKPVEAGQGIDRPLTETAVTYIYRDTEPSADIEAARAFGLEVTEFMSVLDGDRRIIIPVHFNSRDQAVHEPNPALQINGEPVSVVDLYRHIKQGEASRLNQFQELEIDEHFINLFEYGINLLTLPPLVAAHLASKPGMTTEKLLQDYHPNSPEDFTAVVAVSGPSRAGKSQFLAIESFRESLLHPDNPDFVVVASEPFSDYGYRNYLKCLLDYHQGPNGPIKLTDDPDKIADQDQLLLNIIKEGMASMEASGSFPDRVTSIEAMLEEMSQYFQTGYPRPKTIYFDLNGYTPDHAREPDQFDAVTLFACDATVFSTREYEQAVDGQSVPVHVDKRSVDIDSGVIDDYRQQLASQAKVLHDVAYNSQGRFASRFAKSRNQLIFK